MTRINTSTHYFEFKALKVTKSLLVKIRKEENVKIAPERDCSIGKCMGTLETASLQ